MVKKISCVTLLLLLPSLAKSEEVTTQPLATAPITEASIGSANIVVDAVKIAVDELSKGLVEVPRADDKEVQCLAKNIFYEAANESEEGKAAVGLVTINRSMDDRFPDTICKVVDQKTTFRKVERFLVKLKSSSHYTFKTEIKTITVCQFSWRCKRTPAPKQEDVRWQESYRIADSLLNSYDYAHLDNVYGKALYFHSTKVRPTWAKDMKKVKRIGGHIFYSE